MGPMELASQGALSQSEVGRTGSIQLGSVFVLVFCSLTGDLRHKSHNPMVAKEPPDLRVCIVDPDQTTV